MTATATLTSSPTRQGLGVSLSRASVTFNTPQPVEAVREVSLTVEPGEFVSLLGPSGCGKSTLLRAVAGLQRLSGGSVVEQGRTDPRSEVAFVFQDPNLLPWRSVLKNVALPLELMGVARSERLARAADALARVGLADALNRRPAQLSGGMKMRASLARALVTSPRLLLLDEPFAALDEITRNRLDERLRALWLETGVTVLFVTHSISEAVFLSTRAVVFTRRPARLLTDLPIDLPVDRDAALRTDPAFAAVARRLQRALAEAEGAAS